MKRTTIEFSPKMTEVITNLISSGEARTVSEVVRNSIGLYHIAKMAMQEGNKIAIVNSKNKIVKEIALTV